MAAAMASSLAFCRFFLLVVACIKRLANTVDNRSSLNSTGTSVCLRNFWVKAFTFSACLPKLPFMERGKPTIICLTWFCLTILIMASISTVSSLQWIMVNGLANILSGSLRATPIRLSPISRPKLRVISTSGYLRFPINLTPFIPLSFEGEGEGLLLKGFHPFKLSVINNLTQWRIASKVKVLSLWLFQSASSKMPLLSAHR